MILIILSVAQLLFLVLMDRLMPILCYSNANKGKSSVYHVCHTYLGRIVLEIMRINFDIFDDIFSIWVFQSIYSFRYTPRNLQLSTHLTLIDSINSLNNDSGICLVVLYRSDNAVNSRFNTHCKSLILFDE